jgi:hypothetical protein
MMLTEERKLAVFGRILVRNKTICAWCYPGSGDEFTSHGCCRFHALEALERFGIISPIERCELMALRLWRRAVSASRFQISDFRWSFESRAVAAAKALEAIIPYYVVFVALAFGVAIGSWVIHGRPTHPPHWPVSERSAK